MFSVSLSGACFLIDFMASPTVISGRTVAKSGDISRPTLPGG